MKKKKSYADKGIERFKLLLDPFPQLAYCKLVLFIICTFFSQFITKKKKKEKRTETQEKLSFNILSKNRTAEK